VTTGTVLVATAFHIAQLVIGRVVLGIGVGFATQATPLYLSEMAPYNLRGGLNILFQLAVTIGESVGWDGASHPEAGPGTLGACMKGVVHGN
jgi:MFS family permease